MESIQVFLIQKWNSQYWETIGIATSSVQAFEMRRDYFEYHNLSDPELVRIQEVSTGIIW